MPVLWCWGKDFWDNRISHYLKGFWDHSSFHLPGGQFGAFPYSQKDSFLTSSFQTSPGTKLPGSLWKGSLRGENASIPSAFWKVSGLQDVLLRNVVFLPGLKETLLLPLLGSDQWAPFISRDPWRQVGPGIAWVRVWWCFYRKALCRPALTEQWAKSWGFRALGSLTRHQQATQKEGLLEVRVCGGWTFSQGVRGKRELMTSSFFFVSSAQVPVLKQGELLRRWNSRRTTTERNIS